MSVRTYVKTFVIAGVIVPTVLHFLSPEAMPWWPDTASLAIVFGVTSVLAVARHRSERDLNQRFSQAVGHLARRAWKRFGISVSRSSTRAYQPPPDVRRRG